MKLLVQSAMIFFGTLMAAALVALGEPAGPRGPAAAVSKPAPAPVLADARAPRAHAARSQR